MISLLPIVLIVFVLASLFKIAFIYHVFYVLLAVALLARLWTRYAARRLELERVFEERALHGETTRITLRLTNRGLLPVPWLRLHDRLPTALQTAANLDRVVSVGPRETLEVGYDTVCRQRGWYELGPATVELGDVLGVNLIRREFATGRRLIVYPRILPINRLSLPSRTPFGDVRTHRPLYEDPARVVGVREYVAGDSLRKIHWRTSAAAGRLQVKKLEPAMTLQTVVALDLGLGGYDRGASFYATELGIVVAASLLSHLSAMRQEIGLLTNGRDPAAQSGGAGLILEARKGRGHLTRLLDGLARIEAAEGEPIGSVLVRAMGRLAWGSTVVVVTGRDTPELVAALTRLRRAGFALSVVLITQASAYGTVGSGPAALGIPTTKIWRESELEYAGDPGPQRRAVRVQFASS
ncbi:MAG TPA: DUF58 domain-containing protein [Chloroflexota bacterium]|nr:DUF58 domain-containing protein [Chloroflexota bacterium]